MTESVKTHLAKLYEAIPEAVDQLPYTDSFERLYVTLQTQHPSETLSRNEVWRTLTNLRKQRLLPRKHR